MSVCVDEVASTLDKCPLTFRKAVAEPGPRVAGPFGDTGWSGISSLAPPDLFKRARVQPFLLGSDEPGSSSLLDLPQPHSASKGCSD